MKKVAAVISGIIALLILPTVPVLIGGGIAWLARRFWVNRQRKLS